MDGTRVVDALEFKSVTDSLELAAIEYDVAVNVAGIDQTVFLADGVAFGADGSIAGALGEIGSDETGFTVSLFEDTNGANVGGGEARRQVIHASPDAPGVNVTVDDVTLPLFDDLALRQVERVRSRTRSRLRSRTPCRY